jgi:hypothetical protein
MMRGCTQLDLADQERLALRQFVGLGVAVAGGRHFSVLAMKTWRAGARLAARQPERAQHVVEQLPRLADEGLALAVLLLAGRFADDHPVGLRVGRPEHWSACGSHSRRRAAGDSLAAGRPSPSCARRRPRTRAGSDSGATAGRPRWLTAR